MIYTHSHVDHYGGVRAVISDEVVQAGRVRVYAPDGFLRHAVAENVFAGTAMSRRSHYQYGVFLPRDERGQVDLGLGKAVSTGEITLIPPTDLVTSNGVRTIDGVEIEFQLTPGTEAPSEMNFYFPRMRALCAAENACHTLHNLVTLRGAEVRDARGWSRYLDEAIALFGDRADVLFASHHWPTWGTDRITRFLADQRDTYQFLHDQTLRLANHGLTPMEIASDTIRAMSVDLYFDYLGIRLNGDKAAHLPETRYNWVFTDLRKTYALMLRNAALTYREGFGHADPHTTVTLTKDTLDRISLGETTFDRAVADGSVQVEGDRGKLPQLLSLLDDFDLMFPIVTP